jgi:hypothetical protein
VKAHLDEVKGESACPRDEAGNTSSDEHGGPASCCWRVKVESRLEKEIAWVRGRVEEA